MHDSSLFEAHSYHFITLARKTSHTSSSSSSCEVNVNKTFEPAVCPTDRQFYSSQGLSIRCGDIFIGSVRGLDVADYFGSIYSTLSTSFRGFQIAELTVCV